NLFLQYIKYCADLKTACDNIELLQWINGSFVTKKTNPKDIDLVSFVDNDIITKNRDRFSDLKYPHSLAKYGLDAYIVPTYPVGHKHYAYYASDKLYWMDKFDKTRL